MLNNKLKIKPEFSALFPNNEAPDEAVPPKGAACELGAAPKGAAWVLAAAPPPPKGDVVGAAAEVVAAVSEGLAPNVLCCPNRPVPR